MSAEPKTEDHKPKQITLNRAQRRAILKPWKARRAQREEDRKRAAYDIDLRQRVMAALRDLEDQKQSEDKKAEQAS